MRIATSMFLAAAALSAVTPALGSPNYPGAIQDHLGLSYEPPCSICHDGGRTGSGTVNTPFGRSMRDEGLVSGNEGALLAALDALAGKDVDSDGDTVADIDELSTGNDPNRPDKGEAPSLTAGTPAYGCGARIAPSQGGPERWEVFGLAIVALVGSSRRRLRLRACNAGEHPPARPRL